MMWGYFDGGNWLWMAGMMVLFWGGIVVFAVYAIRAFAGTKSNDQALDILGRRLAGGEITQDEFEKTRKALQNALANPHQVGSSPSRSPAPHRSV